MTTEVSQGAEAGRQATAKSRFVAFAFCWADVLLELDETRRVTYATGVTKVVFGLDPEELVGKLFDGLVQREDGPLARQVMEAARKRNRFEGVTLRFRPRVGKPWSMHVAGYQNPEFGNRFYVGLRFAGALTASGDSKHVGTEKLLDSSGFADVAKKLMASGEEGAEKMTLLQVPGLAEASETLDEATRDQMLSSLGAVLKLNSANGDAAAKIGKGKYGVVHDANLDVAELASQVKEVINSTCEGCDDVNVEASTVDVGKDISEETLTKGIIHVITQFGQGDSVTMAKLSGSLDEMAAEAVETAEVFNRVVKNEDFELALHPIVDVHDGEIHHYEALARFHGKHGSSPFKYITFAEETGLISAFDLSVVDKAMAVLKLPENDGISLAINISGKSIVDLRYVEGLTNRLEENTWLKGKMLFELTESSRVEDLESADRFIQRLRELGYPVCLDDFGAGAASFQYLSAIDVDVVKLDGSAVQQAQTGERGRAFMSSLATFYKEMHVETIAEMVDSPEGLAFVRECGVDFAQGYLFGKPSPDAGVFAGVKAQVTAA